AHLSSFRMSALDLGPRTGRVNTSAAHSRRQVRQDARLDRDLPARALYLFARALAVPEARPREAQPRVRDRSAPRAGDGGARVEAEGDLRPIVERARGRDAAALRTARQDDAALEPEVAVLRHLHAHREREDEVGGDLVREDERGDRRAEIEAH